MNGKRKLQDILHSADSQTIDKIAEKYTSTDDETSQRMYERCVQKMMGKSGENSGYTEVFNAEGHKRRSLFGMAGLTAACIAVIGGVFLGMRSIKAPVPDNDGEPPVFFSETTSAAAVTAESGTNVTAETTTKKADVSVTTADSSVIKTEDTTRETTAITAKQNNTALKNKTTEKTAAETSVRSATEGNITTLKTETIADDPVVTTMSRSEREILLAELDAKEKTEFATVYPRQRQILLGNYPEDAPRLTYDEVLQIAENSETDVQFAAEIEKRQPYPDVNTGSGIDVNIYWFDDKGNEGLRVTLGSSFTYFNKNTEENMVILIAPYSRRLNDIRTEESEKDGYMIRERAVVLRNINNKRKHLKLEDFKGFTFDYYTSGQEDFAGFWKKLDSIELYPDIYYEGNGLIELIYDLEDVNGFVRILPEKGTAVYYRYDDPDFSEDIISNAGGLSDETIRMIKDRMNNIIDMTE